MTDHDAKVSRRSVVTAGAWALPAVAVSVAAPSSVASPAASVYSLTVVTPQVDAGETSIVDVTFPESAFPLTFGSGTVTYTPLDATTTIGSEVQPAGWSVESTPDGGRIYRTSGDVSQTSFRFSIVFTGQGSWSVGFAPSEGGTFTGQIAVGTPPVA